MDETALARTNNISAYLFLITAILTLFGTILVCLFTLYFVTDLITPHYEMPPLYKIVFFLLDLVCVAAVVAQVAAFALMKKRSKNARIAAFIAVILTILTFAPFVVILIYPIVFLLGEEGKNFYKIS